MQLQAFPVERVVRLGIQAFAPGGVAVRAVAGHYPAHVFDEYRDQQHVVLDVGRKGLPGQVLLVGAGRRQAEVVHLGRTEHGFKQVGVALPVGNGVAGRERIAEHQQAPLSGRGKLEEWTVGAEPVVIDLQQVAAALVGNAGLQLGNVAVTDDGMVFV